MVDVVKITSFHTINFYYCIHYFHIISVSFFPGNTRSIYLYGYGIYFKVFHQISWNEDLAGFSVTVYQYISTSLNIFLR